MFTGFVTLLRLLWPFFKESMLENGTVRDWLRRHRTTCVWILFQLIQLGVCFYLVEIITYHRRLHYQTTIELNQLKVEKKAAAEKRLELETELGIEQQSNARMRVFLVERCKQYSEPCQFLIEETVKRQHEANQPLTPGEQTEIQTLWCGVVRQADLKDERTRQRYIRDCADTDTKTTPSS